MFDPLRGRDGLRETGPRTATRERGSPDGYEKPEDLESKTLAMTLFGGDDRVAGKARV
jgi:hypothetical protein